MLVPTPYGHRRWISPPSRWGAARFRKLILGGKEMPHFTTEDWIDFVNQVPNAATKSEMASHLEKGCKACQEAASLWQRVRSTAESVNKYQVPESAVRMAKAAFVGSKLRRQADRSASPVELLFDSFLRPVLQGARAA